MADTIATGARRALTAQEADALAGDGPVRLVTCANGRVIGGVGAVGLLEHTGDTDLVAFTAQVQTLRDNLKMLAADSAGAAPRASLFEFISI